MEYTIVRGPEGGRRRTPSALRLLFFASPVCKAPWARIVLVCCQLGLATVEIYEVGFERNHLGGSICRCDGGEDK